MNRLVTLVTAAALAIPTLAAADPDLCDYALATGTVTLPCQLQGVVVPAQTTFYKGAPTQTWQLREGYVSNRDGAIQYAKTTYAGAAASLYSARTKAAVALIDIRDLTTLKALFSLPGALGGFAALTTQLPTTTPAGYIAELFGFAIDEARVTKAMYTACDPATSTWPWRGQLLCVASVLATAKQRTWRTAFGDAVTRIEELVTAPWDTVAQRRLIRNSVFLQDASNRRVVPDTVIMGRLCPYMIQLGFAGWYGAPDVVTLDATNLIEEYYLCPGSDALDSQARHDDPTAWNGLPATAPPSASVKLFPRQIVRIGGRSVAATASVSLAPPP